MMPEPITAHNKAAVPTSSERYRFQWIIFSPVLVGLDTRSAMWLANLANMDKLDLLCCRKQ
jgi:hypothetical protein